MEQIDIQELTEFKFTITWDDLIANTFGVANAKPIHQAVERSLSIKEGEIECELSNNYIVLRDEENVKTFLCLGVKEFMCAWDYIMNISSVELEDKLTPMDLYQDDTIDYEFYTNYVIVTNYLGTHLAENLGGFYARRNN